MKVMAIDIYYRVRDNIAAVAAALEALRAIERHGGSQVMEKAFTGFDALAAPDTFDPHAVLGLKPGASREDIEAKFRALSMVHHPDRGGNADAFDKLVKARAALVSA